MRRPLAALLLALAVAAAPAPGAAQEAPDAPAIDVRVAFDPPAVAVGERVFLTVSVLHGRDLLISAAPPAPAEGMRLIDAPAPSSEPSGERLVTTFVYEMAAFTLGDVQLRALRISWLRADGAAGAVEAPVPALPVQSTLDADDTTLRPLKPQATVAGAPPAWQNPLAAGALVLAVLAGLAALIVVRRRHTPAPVAVASTPASPEETARRRLSELATARLLDVRDFDGYYGAISAAVRTYLEDRFRFRATALTTSELQERMADRGIERWQARLVGGLLDRCDGAVYARRYPEPASADHDLTVAFEIVELTRAPTPATPS